MRAFAAAASRRERAALHDRFMLLRVAFGGDQKSVAQLLELLR